jgi:hypothetical protein
VAPKQILTPDELSKLLRYDANTGRLYWRERTPDTVASDRLSTRIRICRNWNARYSGAEAFTNVSLRGYHTGVVACRRYYAHRVAWAIYFGVHADDVLDHINGDKLDNRIQNLRSVTHKQNRQNSRLYCTNKTGVHGVWWDAPRKKYLAHIKHDGKRVHLGRHTLLEDAIAARKAAEKKFGYHRNHGK